jgi:DNA-binding NarL/FixJ family response regulator
MISVTSQFARGTDALPSDEVFPGSRVDTSRGRRSVMSGFEAARHLRATLPEVPIIISDHADTAYADEAFRIGAQGYVLKRTSANALCAAIRKVLEGQSFR